MFDLSIFVSVEWRWFAQLPPTTGKLAPGCGRQSTTWAERSAVRPSNQMAVVAGFTKVVERIEHPWEGDE